MIGRVVWYAALVGTALVTSALQFDMQARKSPTLAAAVPAPLRNFAQTRIVQAALEQGDPARAVTEAQRLVQRRPLPAENLTLLAQAQARAGQADAAARSIQIAGQRGWRDPLAQEAVLRLALSTQDEAEAARRYAALFLRARTPDTLLIDLGPQVFGRPNGAAEQTLVAVVVGGERWHTQFLQRGARVMPPSAFAAITAQSMAQGAAFNCNGLGQAIATLAQRDAAKASELRASSVSRCPGLAE